MRSSNVMVGMEWRTQDSCYELKLRACSHEVERWVEQESQRWLQFLNGHWVNRTRQPHRGLHSWEMQCVSFEFCWVLGTCENTKWSPLGGWIYETEHQQFCLAKDAKTIWEFLCGVKMFLNVQEKCVDWTQRKLMNKFLRNFSPWCARATWPPLENSKFMASAL